MIGMTSKEKKVALLDFLISCSNSAKTVLISWPKLVESIDTFGIKIGAEMGN